MTNMPSQCLFPVPTKNDADCEVRHACMETLEATHHTHLVEGKLTLEMDEEPPVTEKVIQAGLVCHEGVQGWVQQLHQFPQRQQLPMHGPAVKHHTQ